MKRATPDSNILVSAIVFGGKPGELLEVALAGDIQLVISPEIAAETCGVLRDKFKFSDEMVLSAWERMLDACTMLEDRPPEVRAIPKDPDDDRVIACALAAGVEAILSGDKHLLSLGEFRGIRIQRVSEFLAELHS